MRLGLFTSAEIYDDFEDAQYSSTLVRAKAKEIV